MHFDVTANDFIVNPHDAHLTPEFIDVCFTIRFHAQNNMKWIVCCQMIMVSDRASQDKGMNQVMHLVYGPIKAWFDLLKNACTVRRILMTSN